MKTTTHRLQALRLAIIALAAVMAYAGLTGCSREPAKTITIAYSNDLLGTIHPCDCPGQEYGGLARRATFVEMVRDTAQNFLLLDAGDFMGRDVSFGEKKAEVYLQSMALMGYDGMVVGESDFGFGVDYIVKRTAEAGLPILVANLYDAKNNQLLFPASSRIEYPSGVTIGLIGVMGSRVKFPPQVPAGALRITDPAAAIRREAAGFSPPVDAVVVLAHLPIVDARQLAREVPEIDLIICGHEGRQVRKQDRRFGNAFILQIPQEGKHSGLAFAVLGKEGGIRDLQAGLMPLSERYNDHDVVSGLLDEYGL